MLWYNGTFDGRDALANGSTVPNYDGAFHEISQVYDNFIVPVGQTWTVTSVFSNDEIDYKSGLAVASATWVIRQGVSSGEGGKVVAGGDTTATQSALTNGPGSASGAPAYQITASVPSLTLTAGTYWLSVIPDDASPTLGDQAYIQTTSGAGAVGIPLGNDGNSYISNNLPAAGGYNFAPTSSIEGPGNWDYSMGVVGTMAATVPEPMSLVQVILGGLAAAAFLRSRRARKSSR